MIEAKQAPNADASLLRMRLKWQVLLAAMLVYASFYTGRQNFGFAAKFMAHDLRLSATQIGLISTGLLLAYAMGGLGSGFLADRFGARSVVSTGALLSCLLNWVTSFGHGFWQILIPWVLNGFAQSLGWAPCTKMVANWWPGKQRGTSLGLLLFAASSSSFMTYLLCLGSLELHNWRYVFRLPVLLTIPAAAMFLIFAVNKPADAGLAGSGTGEILSIKDAYGPLIRNRRFLLLAGSIGFESAARYGLLIWVPVHFLGNLRGGPWLTLLLPLGMALGAATTGVLSDRIFSDNRALPVVLLMSLGALMAMALHADPRSNALVTCFLLLFAGFCVYSPQAAYWALGPELSGTDRSGTATGMMDANAYIFAALGEVMIGRTVDLTGTTMAIFPIIAGACLLAAGLALPLAMPRRSAE
jgi:OPA family glycerol-3-phosphate transporter-like MFS transporter